MASQPGKKPPESSPPSGNGPAQVGGPSVAYFIDQLEPEVAKWLPRVVEPAREGVLQAEGELRRGTLGMNGAGLLAVISLLSQSLDALAVRAAAALYFLGLATAAAGWLVRVSALRRVYLADFLFDQVFKNIRANPEFSKPFTSAAEVDQVIAALKKGLDHIQSVLTKGGRSAAYWTYAALACFFAATLLLVIDFEIADRAKPAVRNAVPAAAPAAVVSGAISPPASATKVPGPSAHSAAASAAAPTAHPPPRAP